MDNVANQRRADHGRSQQRARVFKDPAVWLRCCGSLTFAAAWVLCLHGVAPLAVVGVEELSLLGTVS